MPTQVCHVFPVEGFDSSQLGLNWTGTTIGIYESLRPLPPNPLSRNVALFGVYWVICMDTLRMSGAIP